LGIVVAELLQAGCPSRRLTNSVKALKDDSAATMLPRWVMNTAMVVWTALPSGFKGASLTVTKTKPPNSPAD